MKIVSNTEIFHLIWFIMVWDVNEKNISYNTNSSMVLNNIGAKHLSSNNVTAAINASWHENTLLELKMKFLFAHTIKMNRW